MPKLQRTNIVYLNLVLLAVIAAAILWPGISTESLKLFLRVTGRLAFFLFFFSFGASALRHFFKAEWTRYLIQNRRYLGISTVVTLWVHLLAIGALALTNPVLFAVEAPPFITIPGAMTYALVTLMGLTSNNAAQKKLGMKNWKRLHLLGGYAVLAAFTFEYVLLIFLVQFMVPEHVDARSFPAGNWIFLGAALLLLFLRVAKHRRKEKQRDNSDQFPRQIDVVFESTEPTPDCHDTALRSWQTTQIFGQG